MQSMQAKASSKLECKGLIRHQKEAQAICIITTIKCFNLLSHYLLSKYSVKIHLQLANSMGSIAPCNTSTLSTNTRRQSGGSMMISLLSGMTSQSKCVKIILISRISMILYASPILYLETMLIHSWRKRPNHGVTSRIVNRIIQQNLRSKDANTIIS